MAQNVVASASTISTAYPPASQKSVGIALDIEILDICSLDHRRWTEVQQLWIHSMKVDAHSIGYMPTSAFKTRAAANDIFTCYRNSDLVGWCLVGHSKHRSTMKVYQIWVRPDARVIEHGKALISRVEDGAICKHCHQLEAWVAEDLEANIFWAAIGFTRHNWRWNRGPKTRRVYRWSRLTRRGGNFTQLHLQERGGNYEFRI